MTDDLTVYGVDAQINDAKAELAELEQRVISGDNKVTPSMLGKIREKLEFLGLRRKAAENIERGRLEEQRQCDIEAWQSDRREFLNSDFRPLQEAYAAVVTASGVLITLAEGRERKRLLLEDRGRKLGQDLGFVTERWDPKQTLEMAANEGASGHANDFGFGAAKRIHLQHRVEELTATSPIRAKEGHDQRVSAAIAALTARIAEQHEDETAGED